MRHCCRKPLQRAGEPLNFSGRERGTGGAEQLNPGTAGLWHFAASRAGPEKPAELEHGSPPGLVTGRTPLDSKKA